MSPVSQKKGSKSTPFHRTADCRGNRLRAPSISFFCVDTKRTHPLPHCRGAFVAPTAVRAYLVYQTAMTVLQSAVQPSIPTAILDINVPREGSFEERDGISVGQQIKAEQKTSAG